MGILINALSIILGVYFGSVFKEKIRFNNFTILGISIMIISMVSFLENVFCVTQMTLKSNELLIVIFSLIIGSAMGDLMHLEEKISLLSSCKGNNFSEFIDTVVFFSVGGLQICGPILWATSGDSSQLLLKSLIDLPFALMFGISYGKKVSLSAIPMAIGQLMIAGLTAISKCFFDANVIKQLCAMGYIVLFFSGFNLVCEKKYKINNINMIMGIFIILLYNIIIKIWRVI